MTYFSYTKRNFRLFQLRLKETKKFVVCVDYSAIHERTDELIYWVTDCVTGFTLIWNSFTSYFRILYFSISPSLQLPPTSTFAKIQMTLLLSSSSLFLLYCRHCFCCKYVVSFSQYTWLLLSDKK